MEETLEVEGRYYLEEVSLTDTASSKGTISPLPIQIKPPGEYAPDGKTTIFSHFALMTVFRASIMRMGHSYLGSKTPMVQKSVHFRFYPILYFCSDLEHIQRLVDEKQLDEKLKEFRSHESEEKIKLEDFGPMPEMIDDFIRNYFRNMGLNKTLATVILYFVLLK